VFERAKLSDGTTVARDANSFAVLNTLYDLSPMISEFADRYVVHRCTVSQVIHRQLLRRVPRAVPVAPRETTGPAAR
jgi:hypothetical protein